MRHVTDEEDLARIHAAVARQALRAHGGGGVVLAAREDDAARVDDVPGREAVPAVDGRLGRRVDAPGRPAAGGMQVVEVGQRDGVARVRARGEDGAVADVGGVEGQVGACFSVWDERRFCLVGCSGGLQVI